jgi:tetratricopeptide (TPR) repeat protein
VQGYASDRRGELTAAAAQLSRARDLAVRYSLPLLDCMIAIRLGETQLSLGQPREATETTTTLLRTATAIGATRYQILAHYRLGTIAERRGQLIIATDEFNAALVLADEADDEFGRAHARLGLGRLALWQHDADRACHLLAQAFDLAAALKDPLHMFEVLHHWWQARWQRGERRAALAQARKCLRLALRSQSTRVQRAILASLADMATARGDTQLAAGWRAAIGPSSTESGVELTAGIAEALSCAETWLARQLRR